MREQVRYSVSSLRVVFFAVSAAVFCGCSALEFLPSQEGLSPLPPPQNAKILGLVEWRGWGAMLFGFVPVGYVDANDAAKGLLSAAKQLRADGIASVEIHISKTPPPLSFIWWFRSIRAVGIAYRIVGKR